MSRARVAVIKVINKQLTVTAAAKEYGYTRHHLHRLLARYKTGGLDAVDLRYDHVDTWGKVSIRRSGRMHHLGTGASNRGKEILAILDNTTATVIELRTGEILSTHTIDPNKNYWRNTQKSPGRWPGDPS